MSDNTLIEWTDTTQNFVRGCDRASEGCLNCYIPRTPPFRMTGRKFDHDGIGATTGLEFDLDKLALPLRWRKPRKVFVNSLSDLFHKEVPDEVIARQWIVMALTPRHTFQILTKRPARMRALLCHGDRWRGLLYPALHWVVENLDAKMPASDVDRVLAWLDEAEFIEDGVTPLPNVWLGTSTENQKWADVRIPVLLQVPAAVRFISAEPLLGPIDLTRIAWNGGGGTHLDVVNGSHGEPEVWRAPAKRLDWCIVGGESGPKARPMHPAWARTLRNQCATGGVAFHFKQWGEWGPAPWRVERTDGESVEEYKARAEATCATHAYAVWANNYGHQPYQAGYKPWSAERTSLGDEHAPIRRWGKKVAGRELDGNTHDEFPERVA